MSLCGKIGYAIRMKTILKFFDKLEDAMRSSLSRKPILYALVGAVGIILLWKGVWETAELVPLLFGPGSILVGVGILLVTGLLVSFFIGEDIFLSGWRKDKKLFEKTETEVKSEKEMLEDVVSELHSVREDIKKIDRK